jgi:hypothetical protein
MICAGTISPLLLEKPALSSAEGTGEKARMQKSRAMQKQCAEESKINYLNPHQPYFSKAKGFQLYKYLYPKHSYNDAF